MLIAPQFTKLSLPTHYNAPNLSAKSIIPFFLSVSISQTNFASPEIERGAKYNILNTEVYKINNQCDFGKREVSN